MMNIVTIISLAIGVLGLVTTIIGTYLTYISFINPWIRFEKYLKKPNDWEKIIPEQNLTIYRHKKYPGFQVITNWDESIVNNFQEDWIGNFPDKEHNTSYRVRLEANSIFLRKELFVSLDGGRGFVPVPKRKLDGASFEYYYDKLQVQLANIIGEYPRGSVENIESFAATQKIPIKIIYEEK